MGSKQLKKIETLRQTVLGARISYETTATDKSKALKNWKRISKKALSKVKPKFHYKLQGVIFLSKKKVRHIARTSHI